MEKEFKDRLVIIRLNIQEQVGRELAPIYGFQYTPTFIFFDAQGNELWREIGSLNTGHLRTSIK